MHDPFYDLFPRPDAPPFLAGRVALVTIDMQYLDAHPDGWMGRVAKAMQKEDLLAERFSAIERIVPRIRELQDAFRRVGEEVIHVRVAYRTADGRDARKAFMPAPDVQPIDRDERDPEILPEIAPERDEMIFSKTSASVFNSTEIDGVLRRMGIDHLVITGLVTDGCVELSSRDAADRGYSVTLVSDACCASTDAAHADAIQRMTDGGFIAAKTTEQVVAEIGRLRAPEKIAGG